MDGDISSKLNEILNDPQKMSAVMGIVSQMTGEKSPSEGKTEEKTEERTSFKGLPVLAANDDKVNLIRALKPFLDEKGREKADKLIKILGLYSLMNQIKL